MAAIGLAPIPHDDFRLLANRIGVMERKLVESWQVTDPIDKSEQAIAAFLNSEAQLLSTSGNRLERARDS